MEKIRELEQLLAESKLVIQELESRNSSLESKLSKLTGELLYLRWAMFRRSSERYVKKDPNQLSLASEGVDSLPEEKKALVEELRQSITYQRRQKKENTGNLPDWLERKEEIIKPDPIPEGSTCIRQEVTEVLEYTPGTLYVRRIIRKKYALADLHRKLPSLPLPKSNAGASLLARLLVGKTRITFPITIRSTSVAGKA